MSQRSHYSSQPSGIYHWDREMKRSHREVDALLVTISFPVLRNEQEYGSVQEVSKAYTFPSKFSK